MIKVMIPFLKILLLIHIIFNLNNTWADQNGLPDQISMSDTISNSILIEGYKILIIRNGIKQPIYSVAISGLEYGKPSQDNPSEYPGVEGRQYFAPTSSQFDQISNDIGANCVRLAFDLGRLAPYTSNSNYQIGSLVVFNEEYFGYIKNAVQMAKDRGLFIILDLHNSLEFPISKTDVILINNNDTYKHFLAQTWKKIAEFFVADSSVLGYELVNEPNPKSFDSNWFDIAQFLIDTIRDIDQERLLFIDGRTWSSTQKWISDSDYLKNLHDPAGRIVYSPHLYVDININGRYDTGDETPPSNWQYEIYQVMKNMILWAKTNSKPIFFSEIGFLTEYNSWEPVMNEILNEYLDLHCIGSSIWTIDPDILPDHQETYIFGGDRYLARSFSNYIKNPCDKHTEHYIFHNNFQNGFYIDFWDDKDCTQAPEKCFMADIGYQGSSGILLDLQGDWSKDGFNIY